MFRLVWSNLCYVGFFLSFRLVSSGFIKSSCLVWLGLACFGLDLLGFVCLNLSRSVWFGRFWFGLVLSEPASVCFCLVWFGLLPFGLYFVRSLRSSAFGLDCCNFLFHPVWLSLACRDLIWFHLLLFGLFCFDLHEYTLVLLSLSSFSTFNAIMYHDTNELRHVYDVVDTFKRRSSFLTEPVSHVLPLKSMEYFKLHHSLFLWFRLAWNVLVWFSFVWVFGLLWFMFFFNLWVRFGSVWFGMIFFSDCFDLVCFDWYVLV